MNISSRNKVVRIVQLYHRVGLLQQMSQHCNCVILISTNHLITSSIKYHHIRELIKQIRVGISFFTLSIIKLKHKLNHCYMRIIL